MREDLANVPEQRDAVRALKFGVAVGKKLADVAQRSRTQERVHNSVGQHVGVGMAEQAELKIDLLAADDKLSVFGKSVNVVAVTDSHKPTLLCRASDGSAQSVFEYAFGDNNIDRGGQLDVLAAALNDLDLAAQVFDQDWQRVPLGYNLAYKVFDEAGELMALTAASNLYLQALDHDVTYTIVPTTMMSDSDPAYFTVDKATGLKEFIDDAFPAEPEPIIVAHWGTLYVYGDNYNKMVSVWDMNGHLYYERMSSDAQVIDLPRNRVYVVKVGKYVKKIFV